MFSSNKIGEKIKFSIFGGSHQKYIGGKVSNFPSGVVFDEEFLTEEIKKRKPNYKGATPRKEEDEIIFLPKINNGDTIPQRIKFRIENKNVNTSSYQEAMGYFRPSHADYVYYKKYNTWDLKLRDNASGRITLPMVVAGGLCKMFLRKYNIIIEARVEQTGKEEILKNNDTVGGKIECVTKHIPIGLGEPIFYKVQSMLAFAMMSIPSAISFEMGKGEKRIFNAGSEDLDEWAEDNGKESPYFRTETNISGGVNAGISNGNDLVFHVGFHPVHTLEKPMRMIDTNGEIIEKPFGGRHDKAHIFRLPVVVESLAAITLTDLILINETHTTTYL